MAYVSLSTRDLNVLEKIQDPEYDPARMVQVDTSLPKDPNFKDQAVYEKVAQLEREIILSIQQLEIANAKSAAQGVTDVEGTIQGYHNCVFQLGGLIQEYPEYASVRNNRAQAIRRLVGDSMLISGSQQLPQALVRDIDDAGRLQMAETALSDLDRAISLLTPTTPQTKVSQNVARTLSNAHTQRAAIYHMTSKLMESNTLAVPQGRREGSWSKLDFEENASRDFAMGGRYGSEIAKALAVSTNPTAKLCGQMVREALKKEYGPAYSA
ncbi:hypothetical protein QBC32DRAFT_154299 [Pseudoneurospora amorphoporcata]|uniref:Uncharacterized protein n=1 Tax=Pseudoneurospora amorphoporcata TaxID=241081 RepID=A0AAN6NVM8_9PEZI|nr:hypothetical protein QBC32DRAFT_154299 [Pseudoneurospora amorphoporcata]